MVILAALGRYIPIQPSGPAVQNNIHADVNEGVLNRKLYTTVVHAGTLQSLQTIEVMLVDDNVYEGYKYYTCDHLTEG